MDRLKANELWRLLTRGALVGWVAGVFWLLGVLIHFGAEYGFAGVLPGLLGVPVAALLWAVVGCFVGAITGAVRGLWVPAGATMGAFGGAFYTLTTVPPHNWGLGFLYCPGGALAGTLAGAVYGLLWRGGSRQETRLAATHEADATTTDRGHSIGAGVVVQPLGRCGMGGQEPPGATGIQVEKPLPPWEMPGCFRLDCQPHRGNLLWWMAVVSLFCAVCPVPPPLLGVLALPPHPDDMVPGPARPGPDAHWPDGPPGGAPDKERTRRQSHCLVTHPVLPAAFAAHLLAMSGQ